jgi:AAA15 family ATPase/GTPase
LELFHSPNRNTRGAQLIFATHDNTLMNQSLFRRDQIWLVEKDADQASRLFSLYDFAEKPRKGEAIHRGYLAGRYGGVPTLGATFEAVEFR